MLLSSCRGIPRNYCEINTTARVKKKKKVKHRIKSTSGCIKYWKTISKSGEMNWVNLSILKGALTGGAVMVVRARFLGEWVRKKFYRASYLLFFLSFRQKWSPVLSSRISSCWARPPTPLGTTQGSTSITRVWLSRTVHLCSHHLAQAHLNTQQILSFLLKRWESGVHPAYPATLSASGSSKPPFARSVFAAFVEFIKDFFNKTVVVIDLNLQTPASHC